MNLQRILTLLMLLGILATPAWGESLLDKNTHYFQPPVDGSGLLFSGGSEALGMWHMHWGVWADDALKPVNYRDSEDEVQRIVVNQTNVGVVYAIGLFHVLNLGFEVPVTAYRIIDEEIDDQEEFDDADFQTFSFEDMRWEAKWSFLDRSKKCYGLALLVRVTHPIGYQENSFVTDKGLTLSPVIIYDMGRRWWTFATNLGYKYYTVTEEPELLDLDLDINHELLFSAGAIFRVSRSQQLMVDAATRTQVAAFYSEPDLDYAEIALAYRKYWKRLNFTALTAGAGVGLLSGVGNPTVRVFIGITGDERRLGPGDVHY